ncbi:MAG: LysM peptidoglycan-binding domain-containing protein [Acidimicrobiia bacterium]
MCEHEPGPAMGTGTGNEEQRGASAMTISASTPLRVVVLLTSVALALALLLTGAVVARANDRSVTGNASDLTVTAHIQHVVVVGDTLWDIAATYTAPTDDVRDTIFDIKAANNLESSVIVTGQTLVIPLEF